MTLKHLVISGGGHTLFQALGVLYHTETNNLFKLENIESIYGTSAGAIIAVCLALKYDWETLNDYIIKRPWKELFTININNILDSYKKKGIFDSKSIIKCFQPLFDAKNISLNISLYDFYQLTKIEIHFFSFETNEYKIEDISYLTHPDIEVITAVHMSCSLPLLITPVFIENKCYSDGGISCNYPLNFCIESGKSPDEILGIKNNYLGLDRNVTNDSNLLEFIIKFLFKAIFCLSTDKLQKPIDNEIICDTKIFSVEMLNEAVSSISFRQELFDKGISFAKKFFLEKQNITDNQLTENNLENSIQELL
jgi:predicted acylesterase/phospholipase RssA